MIGFLFRRVLFSIPILFGVSVIVFALIQLAPGNPLDLLLPPEASPDVIAQIKVELGYDQPLVVQYFKWLLRVLEGDMGASIFSGRPVIDELLEALSNTLVIAVPAAVVGFSLGATFGLLAAHRSGRWPDRLFSGLAIAGVSLPHYWVAIVLVMIFSATLNLLPAQGISSEGSFLSLDGVQYLVLPIITLSLVPMGVTARMTRAATLEVLSQEFVGALDGRGLRTPRITLHVIRNAAPAVIAIMGLQFGYLVGGSILVETVFNWPGSGNLLNQAIFRRDIPIVQGTILLLALFFVVINLAVDVIQASLDPRMRR